jgi:dihydrodipicolinate synthase/N-acetylneuraminate lyase
MRLAGVTVALTTPLDGRGEFDEPAMERILKRAVGGGVVALSPTGSTGEGPRLGWALRQRVNRFVRAVAPAELPMVSGVNVTSVTETLIELEHLADAGADAALVSPPSYYPTTEAELIRLYEDLAQRSPLPLLLYNIPVFTRVEFSPGVVSALAELPGIIGIKDSSRNMEYLQQVLAHTRGRNDFVVLTGTDSLYLPSLILGVHGTICASANLAPALSVGVHNDFAAGDLPAAMARQQRLAALVSACRVGAFPAGWKAALSIVGLCGPDVAAPALPLAPPLRATLEQRLRALNIEECPVPVTAEPVTAEPVTTEP